MRAERVQRIPGEIRLVPDRSGVRLLGDEVDRAAGGALAVRSVDPQFLGTLIPWLLGAIVIYMIFRPQLGETSRHHRMELRPFYLLFGLGLGFYDGFFGPGTGSFLVFACVRWLGYDFLHASAAAKFINLFTNMAALVLFTIKGHVWWHLALAMAVANVIGSLIGTRLALKHGAGFVRHVFIFVVLALICKTGYDTWLR